MKTPTAETRFFEFHFPRLGTFLRLEVHGDAATIYASRNTFSMRRKEMFIHELSAEGFIRDGVPSAFGGDAGSPCGGVRWVVDHELQSLDEVSGARSKRFIRNVFATSFVLIAVFFGLVFGGSIYNSGASLMSAAHPAAVHASPWASR